MKHEFSKIYILIFIILIGCSKPNKLEEGEIQAIFNQLQEQLNKMKSSVDEARNSSGNNEVNQLVSPRSLNENQTLKMVSAKDWCSGFFPGCLWLIYEHTLNNEWRIAAEKYTASIENEKFNSTTHDMGFKMMCSFGNGYRLTKNKVYKEILIQSAKTLTTRFNPEVGCIQSWDVHKNNWSFPVIIDNMMNLELLFWATSVTGDSTFYQIAVTHALTTLKNHFREDNSSYHVVDYDPHTGEIVRKVTHQGYSNESAWSRGQAWGLYGFTMCYRETGNIKFLEKAEQIAHYILNHKNLPADKIPYWDFDAPDIPNEPRDASAAAIIASALFEVNNIREQPNRQFYNVAHEIVSSLAAEKYLAGPGTQKGFILKHSTGSKPHESEVDVPLIYADYYFIEALLKSITK